MAIHQPHVGGLARVALGADHAEKAPALRRRPSGEIGNQREQERPALEGCPRRRWPPPPAGRAERLRHAARRLPDGRGPVPGEAARDVLGGQGGELARPDPALGPAARPGEPQAHLAAHEPPQHRQRRAVGAVAGDLLLLLGRESEHLRVVGPEAEARVEVEGAGAEGFGVPVADLVGIHDHGADPEHVVEDAEHLAENAARLSLPERFEDVEAEFHGLEQAPCATIAHRDAVPQREEGVVALEGEPEGRVEADERHREPAAAVGQEDVVPVGMGEGVQLPRPRGHGQARRLDQRVRLPARRAPEPRGRRADRADQVEARRRRRGRTEERLIEGKASTGARPCEGPEPPPDRQPQAFEKPVADLVGQHGPLE